MNTQVSHIQKLQNSTGGLHAYTAGCYAAPIRLLYGTAAESNFWDVVFYHAWQDNGVFDTSTYELSQETGLTRQTIGQLRHQAVAVGEIEEDSSLISGRRFVLRVPNFGAMTQGILWKPQGYIRNQWHHAIEAAIPKRVLNLYLQQPRQSIYHLSPQYIAAKCKRRYWDGDRQPDAPLNLADVSKALRLLVQLGLFIPQNEGYRIAWERFNQSPPDCAPLFEAADPRKHPDFIQAFALHAARAEKALELLDVGNYDLDGHFMEIFRDLSYLRPEDHALLKAKVYRQRNRPPDPNRWRNTWRAFQHTLERRETRIQGTKCHLSLDEAHDTGTLSLNLDDYSHAVAVWIVSRVEWPWHVIPAAHGPCVQCIINAPESTLHEWSNMPGDTEKRIPIPAYIWDTNGNKTLHLDMEARCDHFMPGIHVEAWIEACLRK